MILAFKILWISFLGPALFVFIFYQLFTQAKNKKIYFLHLYTKDPDYLKLLAEDDKFMWKFDHADLKYFRGQGDKLTKEANYLKRNQGDQGRAIALAKYSLLYHKTGMRIVFLGLFVFGLFALATYYIFTL